MTRITGLAMPTLLMLSLAACGSGGNLKTVADYTAPPAPPIRHPLYDPDASYGEARATWRPPVADRNGGIVRPSEPATEAGRPDYEGATWATGAGRSAFQGPPGTF